MGVFRTDEPLWYNTGTWGELGYACANFGSHPTTLNESIATLVAMMGRNLFSVMHTPDVNLRVPPGINVLMQIHKLIGRARQIIAGRTVPANVARMDPTHASPAPQIFLVYPVPYFKVRNRFIKEWCGLGLLAMSEAMQHTDNQLTFDIGQDFAGVVTQYLQRIYRLMATELFGADPARASEASFLLSDADFKAYDPSKWFSRTEMVDTIPPLDRIPTEDDLQPLAEGIPATLLLNLERYPSGDTPAGDNLANPAGGSAGAVTTAAVPPFAKPPSP